MGEIYAKESNPSDIVTDDETGRMYVKNQILVSAYPGVDKAVIESIAAEIGAGIVGYIELTNDYQLEFISDKTSEEIIVLIDFVGSFSFISNCSFNYFIESEDDSEMPWEDALYTDNIKAWQKGGTGFTFYNDGTKVSDEGMLSCKTGDNWGLKALNIPAAWQITNNNNSVKVGIYDHGFAFSHKDLSFAKQYNNVNVQDDRSHGTHVAGIIGAKHNNIGIAGVSTNAEIITYSYDGGGHDEMKEKLAFATLIGNHVRVINYSQAWDYNLAYAASNPIALKHSLALDEIEAYKSIMEEFLLKLYTMGYDFNIVTSAGNTNGKKFVEDDSQRYGYYWVERDNPLGKKEVNVLAEYNSALNAITNPILKNRIIVVGSVAHSSQENNTKAVYTMNISSNLGARVDAVAPGTQILSTVPDSYPETEIKGYALQSGTSMAAPHIAGIIALMYQSNPSLCADDAKRIICNYENRIEGVMDSEGYEYYMPDAEKCVRESYDYKGSGYIESENGLVIGKIEKLNGEPIKNINVYVCRSGMDANLNAIGQGVYLVQTDENGTYTCSAPTGWYDIFINEAGYMPYQYRGVYVTSEEVNYIDTIKLSQLTTETFGQVEFKGNVIDAVNGRPVTNAVIRFRAGWNKRTGAYVKDIRGNICQDASDYNGEVCIQMYTGVYTAEITKDGYVIGYYNVSVLKEIQTATLFVLNPELDENDYRIVLSWGAEPRDLDSHLSYIINGTRQFHVYYYNMTPLYCGEHIAMLDLDDVNGYGPETVTITVKASMVEEGKFSYAVHNFTYRSYSNDEHLSASGAKVKVYKGSDLVKTYNVPLNKIGTVWHVFDLDSNGVKTVNTFSNIIP